APLEHLTFPTRRSSDLDVDAGPARLIPRDLKKMNPAIALPPARRLTDLLSSGPDAGVKSKRNAMDEPRKDEDQQLVARTQEGDRSEEHTSELQSLAYLV